jgi:hypothetical protein
VDTKGRFPPSLFFGLAAAASLAASLMGQYISTQLSCPVFACTVTQSGALVERLEIVPLFAGVIFGILGLWLLARRESFRQRLEGPSQSQGSR